MSIGITMTDDRAIPEHIIPEQATIPEHAVVELHEPLGRWLVGARGTVVAVFETPSRAYMLEFDPFGAEGDLPTMAHDELMRIARVVWLPEVA